MCAVATSPDELVSAVDDGACGIAPAGDHRDLLPIAGLAQADVDIRPLLKRRKDRKLLPRSAELALWAAHQALTPDRPQALGLLLGVGREPPDAGETEQALVRSMRDGRFDPDLLAGPGRAAYPPLASLRNLPNLVLAHIAIQLDVTGPGGTRAGGEAAGLAAVVDAWHCIGEGRADAMLTGGADSFVDAGSARDQVRLGAAGMDRAPGEAAAMLCLEALDTAQARGARVLAVLTSGGTGVTEPSTWRSPLEGAIGSCGAAAAPLRLLEQVCRASSGSLEVFEDSGATAQIAWECP